ncbi:hypothetical protein C8R45DRAFT_1078546 [Mycena sanguinolenta]|nr:hypothetical protein C8R45DRAFT_1078546 [Mycena sanguinolenta]
MPSISRRIRSKLTSDGFAARMRRVRIPSDAFDATKIALKAIQASTDACLPLKSGVSVALVLLEMSERIKSNKAECEHLAERAAQIVQDIWRQTKDFNVELSPEVQRSVAEIETLFRKIEAFFNGLEKEKLWQRLARQDRHKSQVEVYGRLLEETISSFSLRVSFNVNITSGLKFRYKDHPPIQHILFTCGANWGQQEEARRCAKRFADERS